jgi:hypothetical protein
MVKLYFLAVVLIALIVTYVNSVNHTIYVGKYGKNTFSPAIVDIHRGDNVRILKFFNFFYIMIRKHGQ